MGSGGKTTFLRWLSQRLSGKIILTTSTHIRPFADLPLVAVSPGKREEALRALREAFSTGRVVCLGMPVQEGKLADPSSVLSFAELLCEADHVLVEADGAAGKPLKAHRDFEPVIPQETELTVGLVGASGLGKPAAEVCHCPGLFCAICGSAEDEPVRAEHIAAVVNRENLADCYLVNQADAADAVQVRRLCGQIAREAFPCSLGRWLTSGA